MSFEHLALFYDDDRELAARLAAQVVADVAAGDAVLLSLPPALADAIAAQVDGVDGRLCVVPAGTRYHRPIDAMSAIWRHAREAAADGARRLHSIGEIAFTGGPADDEWHWYEAACNHVLDDLDLTGTCLYNTRRVPASTLAVALATHSAAVDPPPLTPQPPGLSAAGVPVPEREPDVVLSPLDSPADARRVLRQLGDLGCDVGQRAGLVVTELTTNALRHGGGCAELRVWTEGGNWVVLEVDDDGPGIDDPFATLRPPSLPARGAGLLVSHLEATRLHVATRPDGGTRATALIA